MTLAALPLLLLCALRFESQEIPGLGSDALSGFDLQAPPYRQADIDGDGKMDLLLPMAAFLQRAGRFDVEHAIPPPEVSEPAICDVYGKILYVGAADRLRAYELSDAKWRMLFEQAWDWHGQVTAGSRNVRTQFMSFDRFLQDVDKDGSPEVLVPEPGGIAVYRKTFGEYVRAAVLDVYPPMTVTRASMQPLWPPSARQLALPSRGMNCRFSVEGDALTVAWTDRIQAGTVCHRTRHYTLEIPPEGKMEAKLAREEATPPLPVSMEPMRLNSDDLMDYAGDDWKMAENTPIPMPLTDILISTDGGKSVQTIRVVGFGRARAFSDVDGDGNLDLVAESTGMFDGGVRETLMRFITSRDIPHEVRVYLQTGDHRFGAEPDIVLRTTIQLDAPPVRNSARFLEYQRGGLVNVTGDFDGDGRRDFCVSDRPDRLAVYVNKGERRIFGRPDAVVKVAANADFSVVDLNGDGRSDIVTAWRENDEPRNVVWLAAP